MRKKNLKIEYVPVSDLRAYPNNAKIHTAEQVTQIVKSIEEFGFNDPIAVWKDNEIIEGHGRLLAAIELGLKTVPIIRLDDLTDEQRKAYTLVHNKLTMNTGFDFSILDIELESIEMNMEQFGFWYYDVDWDNVRDLSEDAYEEPEHNMLQCPKCHHIDRDIHFKKVEGVEGKKQNTDY